MFQGERCIKNLVKVNTREPDPKAYIRKLHSIKVTECANEQSLIYNDALLKTMYIEIKARSFMWGQIRIMIETCLKFSKDQISLNDLNSLLSAEEYTKLESGRIWQKDRAAASGLYLTDIAYPSDIFA